MSDNWSVGPRQPQLSPDVVHVWQARLDVSPVYLAFYNSLLADDEQERAARFHFERDRNHYIAGRGRLRVLLGRYLKRPPLETEISYSDYGKPYLPDSDLLPGRRLQFNLAHSGDLALYAFSLNDAVGVDVEVERELSDALAIAERFFSPAERETLKSLSQEQRIPAFFRCWSRKEAFIKAVGEGLSYPLDAFDVTLAPGDPARLLSIRGSAEEARAWSLYSLVLPPGYHGALAMKREIRTLLTWMFEE